MKSIKGLLFVISMAAIGLAGTEVNSDSETVKEDIFTAIRSIDYTSVNVLLSDAINADTVDQEGNTPLIIATQMGNPRLVKIVLSHNPDINLQNNQGETALTIAAQTGQFDIVKKLTAQGADPSLRNGDGDTAETLATKFGYKETAQFLRNI